MHKALTVLAALGIVLAVSSGAYAAKGLLTGADIKNGSLTGADIKAHTLGAGLFTAAASASLSGGDGATGKAGPAGLTGQAGSNGYNGTAGLAGTAGSVGATGPGATGSTGGQGTAGPTGPNGGSGATGPAGASGAVGAVGASGSNGTNGTNGTVTPLWATAGLTVLPTAAPPTTVVSLNVAAGSYVILAKTQIAHSGAGDSIDCTLKAGATTLDQSSMKTLPALAATTVPLEADTTLVTSTLLTVQCNVEVANGSANFSSLIAIPTT